MNEAYCPMVGGKSNGLGVRPHGFSIVFLRTIYNPLSLFESVYSFTKLGRLDKITCGTSPSSTALQHYKIQLTHKVLETDLCFFSTPYSIIMSPCTPKSSECLLNNFSKSQKSNTSFEKQALPNFFSCITVH